MQHFADLSFIAADVSPRCAAEVDQRFPIGWHINYYLGGSLRFARDGGEPVTFTRPTLFWISSAGHFRFGPARAGLHWRHHWVTYRGARAERLHHAGFEQLDPRGYLEIDDHAPMTEAVCALIELVRAGEADQHGRGAVLLEHILSLASQARARRDRADPLSTAVYAVATAVREDPLRHWDFRREAAACGCSYHHFRRLFRALVGRAPADHRQRARLRLAADLLRSSRLPVAAVGDRVGYDDPAHFCKQFKRRFGLAPRDFRRALPG